MHVVRLADDYGKDNTAESGWMTSCKFTHTHGGASTAFCSYIFAVILLLFFLPLPSCRGAEKMRNDIDKPCVCLPVWYTEHGSKRKMMSNIWNRRNWWLWDWDEGTRMNSTVRKVTVSRYRVLRLWHASLYRFACSIVSNSVYDSNPFLVQILLSFHLEDVASPPWSLPLSPPVTTPPKPSQQQYLPCAPKIQQTNKQPKLKIRMTNAHFIQPAALACHVRTPPSPPYIIPTNPSMLF